MSSFLKMFCSSIVFVVLAAFASFVLAEEDSPRYISDTLVINLKDQMEPPFKVVARLVSDDRVLVLQEKGKFIQVKTDANVTGWLAKRYTTEKLPKKFIIKKLQEKLQSLESGTPERAQDLVSHKEREELIDQQRAVISRLETQIVTLKEKHVQKSDYETKYFELEKKYRLLEEAQNVFAGGSQAEELVSLQSENEKLQSRQYLYFFLAGALILAVGIFLGKTPDKRRQKRLFF